MKTATKQRLKVALFLISLFALAGVGVLSYVFHKQVQTPQTKALDAIPNHTALFFECTKFADFQTFNAEAQPLFSIFLNEKQQKNIQQIISLLTDKKYGFDVEKYSNSFYLSVHFSRREISLLFGIEADKRYNKVLKDFVSQTATHYVNETFTYKKNKILKLHIDENILYLNSQNGLLLMTFDESLLRASIDHILLKDSALHNIVHSFAHKRDAAVSMRLYMQYAQCEPVFKKMLEEMDGDVQISRMFTPFLWSAVNVKQKKGELIFSGYAIADTAANAAKLFSHADKAVEIEKLLPCNAQNIFCVNAGKYQRFSQIKPYVQTSEDVFGLMYPSQAVTFKINHNDLISNGLLLVSENPSEAAFHLFNSVGSEFEDNKYLLDTFYVHTAMVGKVNLNNFMITQFAYNQDFPKLQYYTVWDNCIVFTDTQEGMISYLQLLREGKTLKTNEKFQALSSYFSNQANMLYYNGLQQKSIQNIRFQYDYFSGNLFSVDAVVRF